MTPPDKDDASNEQHTAKFRVGTCVIRSSLIGGRRRLIMMRDIDHIIERLKAEMPDVRVAQLRVTHSGADDDGLWFIKIPGGTGEVQVESSDGSCPFLIESSFSAERFHGQSIDEVIQIVRRFYA